MYLSRLDLHGFKSFAQKTTVQFAPGVTVIVGPNGCGKSNVIDAVRWVLGEQRARLLRSDKMEGVLFNGAAGRRPLGMAEVSLTVENTRGVLPTEFAEVTVTRRLYRNGDAEYLLGGTPCRLRDVLDLFMDTGLGPGAYSVIELRMIEDILSETAADRRRLFEEAAGVTRYKLRRRQALQKLDATRDDLTRLGDIVDEVEKQVRALERQAQKARRHARLAERLRSLELALTAHDDARLDAERQVLEPAARAHADEAERLGAEGATGEAALEKERTALVGYESALADRSRARAAHAEALGRAEAESRVLAERARAARAALDRLAAESRTDDERALSLAAGRAEAQAALTEARAEAEQASRALALAEAERARAVRADAETRTALETARHLTGQARAASAQASAALVRLRDRRALRQAEAARARAEVLALADAPDAAGEPGDEALDQALALADQASALAAQALALARSRFAALREASDEALAGAQAARARAHAAHAEAALLGRLVASGEHVSDAAAFLHAHARAYPAEPAPPAVADVLGCADADRLALEAALGAWGGALVVTDDAHADRALASLREGGQGRATFLALDRLARVPAAEASPEPAPPGTTLALSLARPAAPRYAPLLTPLLGRTFVAGSLAQARALAESHPRARFVTREGACVSAWGAVHGGGTARGATAARLGTAERLAQAERAQDEADESLAQAQALADQARAGTARAEAALREAEAAREAARTEASEARTASARAEAARTARAEAVRRAQARADEAALALAGEPEEDPEALREAEAEAERLAQSRAEAERLAQASEAERRQAEGAWNEARLARAEALARVQAAERDLARARQDREGLARRQEARAAETFRLSADLAQTTEGDADRAAALEAARAESHTHAPSVERAEADVLAARARIADAEGRLRRIRHAREAATGALAGAERRLAEIAVRQEALQERLAAEHGAALADAAEALAALGELFDPEAARAEVPRLREGLRSLGAVNALALESFDEQSERLAFLTAQRRDVLEAEASIESTIEEINRAAAERFGETFGAVREAFRRLFTDLFGEDAAADLVLAGDDPLEAPIEITARPRGKRPVGIGQLSGGEKTLTAIALLFAIYLVKPSPFCILDEVDAPLDDANVDRFMRLIRAFAGQTQFILVTHNKRTMEAADRMYGVTMPEPGVSRLVGVAFEAEKVEE